MDGTTGPHDPGPGDDGSPLTAEVDLPLHVEAAALARRTVRDVLRGWAAAGDEERVHDVLVVTSELVGNAVRHGGVRVALRLALDGGRLRVAVSDGSAVLPRPASDPDESGRGLAIVAALSQEWGTQDEPGGGKTVWAVLQAP